MDNTIPVVLQELGPIRRIGHIRPILLDLNIANRKSPRYVRGMSSIGFAPRPGSEVEQLRSAYRSLNDVTRNLASAARCVKDQDLKMAEHHLRAAEWHLAQAKQTIANIGQTKRKNV